MSDPVQLRARGLGVQQHMTGTRVESAERRLDAVMALAEQTGAHVWLAMTGHLITPALAVRLADGSPEEPVLDTESLMTVQIGCFRCERELTSARARQPCPGEPS